MKKDVYAEGKRKANAADDDALVKGDSQYNIDGSALWGIGCLKSPCRVELAEELIKARTGKR